MEMQTQEMAEWCWAAVSVSVDKFFNPASSRTQCTVAEDVLTRSCCGGEAACNEPADASAAYIERYWSVWREAQGDRALEPKAGVTQFVVVADSDHEALTIARRDVATTL